MTTKTAKAAPEPLQIEQWELTKLTPYPDNARGHPKEQIRKLVDSIRRYGFTQPILVDEEGVIIAGHGRFTAAQQLGMETVPVVVLHLSDADKMAYRIADNVIPSQGEWHGGLLAQELLKLHEDHKYDLALTGLDDSQIGKYLKQAQTDKKVAEGLLQQPVQTIKIKKVECPNCRHQFEFE